MSEPSPAKISRARKAWIRRIRASTKVRRRAGQTFTRSGDGHVLAVLTRAKVQRMRELHAQGSPIADLALRYGVTYRTAWSAVTGRTWR